MGSGSLRMMEILHMMGRVSLQTMVGRMSRIMRHYNTSCLVIASYDPLLSCCSDSQAHLCDDDDHNEPSSNAGGSRCAWWY